MAVWVVTGKLGSGKSLVAVSKIQEYLNKGRVVATNLDLFMEYLVNPFAKKTRVIRLPDKPTAEDLDALPAPYEGEYDENKSGLIVFDECATWFNSRNWNDKQRAPLINKLLHIRKCGWDVIFIIQNVNAMDSQAREMFAEMIVYCRRMDRFTVPFISWFFRLGGFDIRPPRIHIGLVKYGTGESSPLIERWIYRGRELYNAYDTRQVFTPDSCSISTVLPPWYIYGRYTNEREHARRRFINSINRMATAFKGRSSFLAGLLCCGFLFFVWSAFADKENAPDTKASQQAVKSVVANQSVEPQHELSGVYITASVRRSSGFDYVFERDNGVVYPEFYGYDVGYVSDCKASLIKEGEVSYVTCSPFRAAQPSRQPREGAGDLQDGRERESDSDIFSRSSNRSQPKHNSDDAVINDINTSRG
ncbi:zonular occludens toxin domain-containing protein [Shewanella algae]|uniref:zonular occludens toxin domain-containing protein n=1 Tax=Shewanella algae TaxID=38313 RepID=UPI001AAD392F|nr:zonular occludens toxin domain-containing protein [Shewanella algae]MBO2600774.1 hypothetical protein [Shewanella algae]MBO2600785.1 hypothetical protein [Shewanella algae]